MAGNEPCTGLLTIAWWAYTRPRAAARYLGQISPSDLSLVAAAENTPEPLIWLSQYPRVPQYGWGVAQSATSSFILEGRDTLSRRILWAPYRLQPQLGWVAISDIGSTTTFGGEAPYPLYLKPIQWPTWQRQPQYGWAARQVVPPPFITHDESGPFGVPLEGHWQPPGSHWPGWTRQPQRGWSTRTDVTPAAGIPVPPTVTSHSGTGTFVASGSVEVSANATSLLVTGPFVTASYEVFLSTSWLTDANVVGIRHATSFTVIFSVPAPATGGTLDWMVWR